VDLVSVLFTLFALVALGTVLSLAIDGPGVVTFTEWAGLVSSMAANACLLAGVVLLRTRGRLEAYQWFDRGLLISIFITQIFVFAEEQLGGTVGLVVLLAVWILLRSAMRAERERAVLGAADT
jgi:hypothetical protein